MLALLLAALSAFAAPAAEHTASMDLFQEGQPGAPDWNAARAGAAGRGARQFRRRAPRHLHPLTPRSARDIPR